MVSRLIYTGAGGFDATSSGIRFVLSPRVPHLAAEVSELSTLSRGVLHTKNESLSSAGYNRLHLLCSESLFSEWAIFLRVGVTAIVVAMIVIFACEVGVSAAADLAGGLIASVMGAGQGALLGVIAGAAAASAFSLPMTAGVAAYVYRVQRGGGASAAGLFS